MGEIYEIILSMNARSQCREELLAAGFSAQFDTDIILNDRSRYFSGKRADTVLTTLDRVMPELGDEKISILDVGCGYGDYASILAAQGHSVTGTNWHAFNEDFLFVNKLLGIETIVCDINDLPFEDNSFDMTLCIGVLTLKNLTGQIPHALKELRRVSRRFIGIRVHEKTMTHHGYETTNDIFEDTNIRGDGENWIIEL